MISHGAVGGLLGSLGGCLTGAALRVPETATTSCRSTTAWPEVVTTTPPCGRLAMPQQTGGPWTTGDGLVGRRTVRDDEGDARRGTAGQSEQGEQGEEAGQGQGDERRPRAGPEVRGRERARRPVAGAVGDGHRPGARLPAGRRRRSRQQPAP